MTASSKAATRRREAKQGEEGSRSVDPLEGVDLADPSAVRQALTRLAAEEAANRPPRPKDRAEAKLLFEEEKLAYKARMLARGIDFDDLEGTKARLQARGEAILAGRQVDGAQNDSDTSSSI